MIAYWRNLLPGFFVPALLVIYPFAANAQNLNEMRFDLLDEEDGLSNHWIYHFVRDSSGYVWITTNDGLNRYDGHHFKVFRHHAADTSSLLNDNAASLFVDPSGKLWVGYTDGGLSTFDQNCQCFTHHWNAENKPRSLPGSNTNVLYMGRDKRLWISGMGAGLNAYQPDTKQFQHYDLPNIHEGYSERDKRNYNTVFSVYEASNGLLWLSTANGLYTFAPQTGSFSYKQYAPIDPQQSRNDYFMEYLPDGNKGLWLSSWGGGISYYDIVRGKFSTYRYDEQDLKASIGNIVYDLAWKSKDEFWIATEDRGLGIFNTRNHTFQFRDSSTHSAKLLVMPDSIMFILSKEGLLKYNPNSRLFHFRPLPIAKSQNNNQFHISKIIEDPENNAVYFATELGNGLNVLDTRTGRLTAHPVDIHPSSSNFYMIIGDLLLDQNGRLWVLSSDYLYAYDKTRKRLEKITNPFRKDEYPIRPTFNSFHTDPNGDTWVLTDQGGIHRFFPAEKKLSPMLGGMATSDTPVRIERIAWDRHARMWVVGGGKTGYYDKATQRFVWVSAPETQVLANAWIRGMAADNSGNIWIAVLDKGLLKLNTQDPNQTKFQLITTAGGLPTTRISNMQIDPQGTMWISTIIGVAYMNPANLSCRMFNQTVGMDKNTIYMRFSTGKDGTFYITTPGKYCKVAFDVVNRKVPKPKVYLDKFSVFNKEKPGVWTSKTTITLQPGEDFFSFEFGCIDYTSQALNKFAYRLDGWDKDWVQSGVRRYASYTNLNGGHYVFNVKVANSEGVWSDPVSVPVFIETPIHQKSWFIGLAALFFTVIIYALYLYRVRQIEKTERLKTEFNRQLAESRLEALRAQMNPHFIFNCLNSINRYIIKGDVKTSSLYLTRFAKLIRLILDNSEHKKVVLANEMEALRLYVDMEALRFDHKFTFDISIDENVDADHVEVPPLIIQPYVENAIWHGLLHKESGGHLSVRISQNDDILICEITDDGVGRAKAMEYKSKNAPTRKSVGMKLTEERLKIQTDDVSTAGSQQIIDLFDEQGAPCGTKVILKLPV